MFFFTEFACLQQYYIISHPCFCNKIIIFSMCLYLNTSNKKQPFVKLLKFKRRMNVLNSWRSLGDLGCLWYLLRDLWGRDPVQNAHLLKPRPSIWRRFLPRDRYDVTRLQHTNLHQYVLWIVYLGFLFVLIITKYNLFLLKISALFF